MTRETYNKRPEIKNQVHSEEGLCCEKFMAIFMRTIIANGLQLVRATLEELAPLRWLWQRVDFTAVELEKSRRPFYLLIDDDHNLLAALAVQFRQKDAFYTTWLSVGMIRRRHCKYFCGSTEDSAHQSGCIASGLVRRPPPRNKRFQSHCRTILFGSELHSKQPGLQIHLTRDPRDKAH